MTTNFGKLDKFEGHDFRRWQKKMHFLLTTLKVVYVLTTPMPELMKDATVEAIRIRAKWENDDYICRGHILNEDSSSKKFLVSNFNNYKMVDSRPVIEQYNELLRILGQYTQHGLKMDVSISVSSIIDKLPHSWKDFKHTLKHGKDDLSLVQLGSHLRIEESLRAQESDKGKGKEVGGPFDAIAWWIDSGATSHVCKDRCWFKTYEPVEDGYVLYMVDDHFAPDHGKGRSSSSSDSEVDSYSKSCVKDYATLKEQYDSLSSDYKKSQFNLVSYKTGLGNDEATTASPTVESFMNLTDKTGSDKEYHFVPPPLTRNFIPRKPDLTFLDEIVENYTISPSIEKIESVKNIRETDAPKQNKQNPRGNQRNWNNLMSQRLGNDFKMTNKACYTCGSFEHLHYVCDKKVVRPAWNNSSRVNHKNFSNKMTHPHPKRSFVPQAVLTRSGKLSTASAAVNTVRSVNTANTKAVNTARPVNTAASKQTVNHPRSITNAFKRGYSQSSRPFNRHFLNKNSITKTNVNTVSVKHTTARDRAVVRNKEKGSNAVKASACWDNPQQKEYKEKAVIDSGCSRHMTGNKCYLDEYEDYDGGFVSFGDGKGRISGKGKIKTGSLDFDDVFFCKELKYNLFSVSQICDKKNNVLFTDTECLVLSSNFKLLDESQVLLRVPRKDNIYSVDLKSVVPTGGLTCLIAKATIDESNTWHRRLGHINFKTMNKLVKGNLVKGLPSKIFENDHSCVACQKGKQHKASYKTKLVNSISKPLHMLHMDLFGPTNVKSLMKKSYCLVVTDDFSRFSWVFFLATKDETSGILKTFITEIENQLDHKVKVIRSDNGTEFKNSIMNQFCEMKGIKREFSVARTPQQNGVARKKNRTLIEAATTMLVDSKLPTTFWAEAVNTACYVLNGILVIKSHNKTPYELIHGRPPLIDFMKPFGYLVTILNTRDLLGKFDGKADKGYFVGYSVVSKAMRVFNKRTRIVEETLNIRFLENTPNVKGNGLDWIFDVDSLSISMNYVPVAAGNKTNGPKDYEGDAGMKPTEVDKYDALDKSRKHDQEARSESKRINQREMQTEHTNSSNVNTVRPSVSTANESEEQLFERFSSFKNAFTLPPIQNISSMDNTGIFRNAYDDEDVEEEVDMNNVISSYTVPDTSFTKFHKDHPEDQVFRNKKDERGIVMKNKARLFAQGHTQDEGIDYDEVFAPVARIEAIRLFLAYASFKDFIVYQMDVKSVFLSRKIEEEVYVCQPPSFEDPHFPDKVYKVEKALYGLHQAPRAWYETLSTYLLDNGFHRGQIDKTLFIKRHKDDTLLVQVKQKSDGIFISQDKYVAKILKKFDFASVKTTSTLMETNKAFVKDEEAEDVDVHLYRSMIGSLMYLTASRPDIMFVVCACARFQVTPKASHFNAVKRIFRYLKGQPKLGLWYPRDSPFDLEDFSDSDYAGASLDRKSTTGGCQFLGKRLISWQCKKQTIVANSTTEAEYVVAANCCRQVLWIQNQMLDYGFNFINTKIYIDNESTIYIVKNPVFHSKTKHIEIRHHFIRDSYEKKLIQVIKIHTKQNVADLLTKAFDVSRLSILSIWTPRYLSLVVPLKKVGDEAVHKELGDRMERAATTASSLEAEQDSGSGPRCQDTMLGDVDAQTRFETTSIQSNDPPLSKVNTSRSGEDNLKLMELMAQCTKLSDFMGKKNREKCHIYYALTECPTLYISLIKQFWQTAALSTIEDGVYAITTTIDRRDKIITEASIRRHLKLQDSEGLSSLPNAEIFEQLTRMGYATTSDSLTFLKGHFAPQWKFFIHTILHCMSSKKTAWDQFSSNIATAIICLATNRIFNFSRFIFDAMPQGEAPSTSPSRITSLPSLSSHYTTSSTLTTPPSIQITHEVEETATMPHDSPLPGGHTPGSDEGRMQHTELMELITKLIDRIEALEKDLQQTKKTYSTALTKLVLKGKKLEKQVKSGKARRRARIVLSEDGDVEDVETQEKNSADTEVLLEEETPTEIIEDLGSGEKEISTINVPVSTAGAEVSTGSHAVSTATAALVYIRRSASKAKGKGQRKGHYART
ncbi:putative ribonuclease H-like domain-containing protein [Tanacetum coccineum]